MGDSDAQKTYSRAWPPAFLSSDYLVGEMRKQSIDQLAQRSDRKILYITFGFALGGALFDVISHSLAGFGVNVGMLWGIWIPLCCLLIPAVHYLSRQVVALRERLDALEMRLESSPQNPG